MMTDLILTSASGLIIRMGIVRPESRDGTCAGVPSRMIGLGHTPSPFRRMSRYLCTPTSHHGCVWAPSCLSWALAAVTCGETVVVSIAAGFRVMSLCSIMMIMTIMMR